MPRGGLSIYFRRATRADSGPTLGKKFNPPLVTLNQPLKFVTSGSLQCSPTWTYVRYFIFFGVGNQSLRTINHYDCRLDFLIRNYKNVFMTKP